MTIEYQNGVDRVDRKAQWPHFLNKKTRFCFVGQRVPNVRWGRRCWDCPNWSFDEGCPKSCFPHRGLRGGLFYVFIGMVRVPKMRHGGFFFFSRPTGLLQRSGNVM